jgi:hypothetical protein
MEETILENGFLGVVAQRRICMVYLAFPLKGFSASLDHHLLTQSSCINSVSTIT